MKVKVVDKMSNNQLVAILEAIKIIAESTKDPGEIIAALDRIQSKLKKDKSISPTLTK